MPKIDPEKRREYTRRYLLKNPRANVASVKRYQEKHPEKMKASSSRYYQRLRDDALAYRKLQAEQVAIEN